jgi:hypothetical protein
MPAATSSSTSVAGHFQNHAPDVSAVYQRILRAARALGAVGEESKKTSIHLLRESAFAGIATQKEALVLTLKLSHDLKSPRVRRREQTSKSRWHVEIRLDAPGQVDAELIAWIREAYELAG